MIALSAYKTYAPTCCKLAEEIFSLLGMENVKSVNLHKTTKDRGEYLMACGTLPNPADEKIFVTPSAKFIYSLEWWFYY